MHMSLQLSLRILGTAEAFKSPQQPFLSKANQANKTNIGLSHVSYLPMNVIMNLKKSPEGSLHAVRFAMQQLK